MCMPGLKTIMHCRYDATILSVSKTMSRATLYRELGSNFRVYVSLLRPDTRACWYKSAMSSDQVDITVLLDHTGVQ